MGTKHEHAELIKAWADGAEIEYYTGRCWVSASTPNWTIGTLYRIKPEPKPSKSIMTWDYRVIKATNEYKEDYYYIHEVYYNEDGDIESWTENSISPFGYSPNELWNDLHYMMRALEKPVLEVVDGKLVEVKE